MFADGTPWKFLSGGAIAVAAARLYFTNQALTTASSPRHIIASQHARIPRSRRHPYRVIPVARRHAEQPELD